MKIAINTWILRNKKLDGIGYFTVQTISRIIKNNPQVQFQILADKKFTEDYFNFPNATIYRIFPALRHPLLYVFYLEFVLPFFLRKHKPDALIAPDGMISLCSKTKQIPVLHDINFEHYPKDLPLKNRLYYRFFFHRFAEKATAIATVSEYSKKDIIKEYKVGADKISVIYSDKNADFLPLTEQEIINVRKQYSNGQPYFFFIGSLHPRKNIVRLIQAFEMFKLQTSSNTKLLLAGNFLWDNSVIINELNNCSSKNDIVFLGRVSNEAIKQILPASLALMFVSTFEGFGVPIIEGFHSGVPVITSNTSSMPEIAGNAALLVNPFNIDEIKNAMQQISEDDTLRSRLIEKGHQQKLLFSWDDTAKLLWNCAVKKIDNC